MQGHELFHTHFQCYAPAGLNSRKTTHHRGDRTPKSTPCTRTAVCSAAGRSPRAGIPDASVVCRDGAALTHHTVRQGCMHGMMRIVNFTHAAMAATRICL